MVSSKLPYTYAIVIYRKTILDHKITTQNLNRLTMADLQLLCPIIGDRLRLEEEIQFIRSDKLYPARAHELNVVGQLGSKVSNVTCVQNLTSNME